MKKIFNITLLQHIIGTFLIILFMSTIVATIEFLLIQSNWLNAFLYIFNPLFIMEITFFTLYIFREYINLIKQ